MLIKFTDFITWPEKAFEKTPETFVIGILGSLEIFNLLEPLNGKLIQGRKLSVINLTKLNSNQTIHLLYLDNSHIDKFTHFIGTTKSPPILTVSDSENFLKAGGIIRFIIKKSGHVGFAVNRTAQLRSELTMSSSLLRLAKIRHYDGGPIQ